MRAFALDFRPFVHFSNRSINRSFRSVPSVHSVASVRSVAASMSVPWFVHVFLGIILKLQFHFWNPFFSLFGVILREKMVPKVVLERVAK